MRVLVTGGLGFIGSHIVNRYVDMGWEVHCLDSVEVCRRTRHLREVGQDLEIFLASIRAIVDEPLVVSHVLPDVAHEARGIWNEFL